MLKALCLGFEVSPDVEALRPASHRAPLEVEPELESVFVEKPGGVLHYHHVNRAEERSLHPEYAIYPCE